MSEEFKPAGRRLNPIASLMKRGRIGMWAALAVFVLGLPFVFVKGQANFVTESVFEVFPSFQMTQTVQDEVAVRSNSNSNYRQLVNQLSTELKRYDLLDSAISKLEKSGIPVCEGSEASHHRCIRRLQRTLVVLPVLDTYMVRVLINAEDPKYLDDILNELMSQFETLVRSEQLYGADDRIKALVDQKNKFEVEMADYEEKRAAIAADLGVTSFTPTGGIMNPYDTVLAKLRDQLITASIERSLAENSLKAYQDNKDSVARETFSVAALKNISPDLTSLTTAAINRLEVLNQIMAGLKPAHPSYQAAKDEYDLTLKRLIEAQKKAETEARETVTARLTSSFQQTAKVEQELQKNLQETSTKAGDYAKLAREAEVLTEKMNKRTTELNAVRDRIREITLERGAIGWVRVMQPALPAERAENIGRFRMLLLLMLVCLLVALVVPIVLDMLDRRILTVGDAEKAMGMQAAGWLVDARSDVSAKMLQEEQSRRLASTLLRNKLSSDNGVFAFAPLGYGGESTEAILDIAKTLQILGTRVLVVDANHMRLNSPINIAGPNLHDMLSGKVGPMSAIGSLELKEISMSSNGGLELNEMALNVVGLGSQSAGLQRLDRLKEAFAVWSKEFDIVLVEVPPIMHSADSELLIDMIGQVFLIVEVGEVGRSDVLKARQQISRINPAAVGLIVTHVPMMELGNDVQKQMTESITQTRFSALMTLSEMQLKIQIALLMAQTQYLKWAKAYPVLHGYIQSTEHKIDAIARESYSKARFIARRLYVAGLRLWVWGKEKIGRNKNLK